MNIKELLFDLQSANEKLTKLLEAQFEAKDRADKLNKLIKSVRTISIH